MREVASTNALCRVCIAGGCVIAPVARSEERVARITLLPETLLGHERGRRLDPLSQLALIAVERARREAGLAPGDRQRKLAGEGVAFGSALGAVTTSVRYAKRLVEAGPNATNPIDFPDSIDGAAAAHVAIDLGLGGPSITFADGVSSAVSALVCAARQIAWGRATRMHVIAGDTFDTLFAQALADDPSLTSVCPSECVLAMVLEALDGNRSRSEAIELGGFLPCDWGDAAGTSEVGSDIGERVPFPLSWVTEPNGVVRLVRQIASEQKRLADPSGALELAGAWLAAVGSSGRIIGVDSVLVPEPIGSFVHCGSSLYPRLGLINPRMR